MKQLEMKNIPAAQEDAKEEEQKIPKAKNKKFRKLETC